MSEDQKQDDLNRDYDEIENDKTDRDGTIVTDRREATPCQCDCGECRDRQRYRPRCRDAGYSRSSGYSSYNNYGCRECSARSYQYQPRAFSTSTFPVYPRIDIATAYGV
ncbi:unnamed protein product [Allacma fusca]|uniref:Uncharacterized protein n=1 Tax=Allacma fusca TaxID=39272 RepID=A0A8J2NM96_9HEXA|nr:unnamed protein product [Allacma fusca]